MKAIATINARMGSTRLPGKSLMDICGRPLLTRVLNRVRQSNVEDIVLATTTKQEDDVLEDWAHKQGIACHRGSSQNVLQRTIGAALPFHPDILVRVCGDTPLIDPYMIDLGRNAVQSGDCRFIRSTNKRRFPHGTTAHVCMFEDLVRLEDDMRLYRENVTFGLYDPPRVIKSQEFCGLPEWDLPGQRLQVDYQEDLDVVREIYKRLGPGDYFGIGEVVELLKREPWIQEINKNCKETVLR